MWLEQLMFKSRNCPVVSRILLHLTLFFWNITKMFSCKDMAMSILATIILTSLFFSPIKSDVPEPADNGDWMSLERQIFQDEGGILRPEKTLELLRELKYHLTGLDKQKLTPTDKILVDSLKKRVSSLIQHSVPLELKCRLTNLYVFHNQLQDLSNSLNIEGYLEFYWNKQQLVCEKYLAISLEEAVNELEDDDRRRLELLSVHVWKTVPTIPFHKYKRSSLHTVTEGILNYMKQYLGYDTETLLGNQKGEATFEEEFRKLTVDTCKRMEKKLNSILAIYKLYSDYMDGFENRPRLALDMLAIKEICAVITPNEKFFIEDGYKMLKKSQPKPKLQDRIRKCWTGARNSG